jgi:phosphoribosyl 1,2-cyclic phosphodiesterase
MMKVTFYGVRGSVPTPGIRFARYGGNTSCVAAFPAGSSDQVIIVDAGTGIRALGGDLLDSSIRKVHLFLTHFHWDHIQGLPFFAPLFDERFVVNIYAAHPSEATRELLTAQMTAPFFPLEPMRGKPRFATITRSIRSTQSNTLRSR